MGNTPSSPPPPSPPSPSGFSFHYSPKSWHAARQDCQSRGGDLASIHSEAEQREAFALTGGRDAWIGLNDEEDEGNHVWSDGTPMDYHGWSLGQPDNYDGNEDCGHLIDWTDGRPGPWSDSQCEKEFAYICIDSGSDLGSGFSGSDLGSGFSGSDLGSGFSGSGFSFHSSPKSWHAARQDCQSRGGDLASIHSEAENREAFALTGGRHAWIGLNDKEDEGNHVWSDGTPMDYHGWSGYPASPPLPPLPHAPPSPPSPPPSGSLCSGYTSMEACWPAQREQGCWWEVNQCEYVVPAGFDTTTQYQCTSQGAPICAGYVEACYEVACGTCTACI